MREGNITMETETSLSAGRRRSDDPTAASRRVGVIWSGEATTEARRVLNVVLDISPDGAKLQTDLPLFGEVDTFRLSVQGMSPIDCVPVWQQDGRVGVRFIGGPSPTMSELDGLVYPPELAP